MVHAHTASHSNGMKSAESGDLLSPASTNTPEFVRVQRLIIFAAKRGYKLPKPPDPWCAWLNSSLAMFPILSLMPCQPIDLNR